MENKEHLLSLFPVTNKGYELFPNKDYEVKQEGEKFYLVKKKKMYPKTYEECCNVLDWNHRDYDRVGYESELLCKFQVLLLCRDAYWKIAGEEMRFGKPWEPDWLNLNVRKHCIYYVGNEIRKQPMLEVHHCLAFPTEEMRDAFFENFESESEFCKELL